MDVTLPSHPIYILVIDTNAYSGNFEREIAGYTTGIYDGERYHGGDEARNAQETDPVLVESMAKKSISVRHKEYGFVTNTIRPTPGRLNNGAGYHYDVNDTQAEAEARKKSTEFMRNYHASQIAMCEGRLRDENFEEDNNGRGWTKEACARTIRSAHESIERAGHFVGYPAYESVAMFFREPLSDEEMEFVKERAHEYAAAKDKPFEIRDVYMMKMTAEEERI